MAHTVYHQIYSVLQTFRICSLFCTFLPFRNYYSGDAHHANYCKHSLNNQFLHGAHSVYQIYSVFKLFEICSLFCTFWLFRNFYSGDAHHANYGKHSLNHHFRHGAHSVYKIYSVFKLFEIAVCFAHFDFFEITTPVMRIMLTMANIFQSTITVMAHTVYIRFSSVFKLFEFAVCSAHFEFLEITTPVMHMMLTMTNIV